LKEELDLKQTQLSLLIQKEMNVVTELDALKRKSEDGQTFDALRERIRILQQELQLKEEDIESFRRIVNNSNVTKILQIDSTSPYDSPDIKKLRFSLENTTYTKIKLEKEKEIVKAPIEKILITVKAIVNFEARNENELTLKKGDIIAVLDISPTGWWKGRINDKVGLFESTCCDVSEQDRKKLIRFSFIMTDAPHRHGSAERKGRSISFEEAETPISNSVPTKTLFPVVKRRRSYDSINLKESKNLPKADCDTCDCCTLDQNSDPLTEKENNTTSLSQQVAHSYPMPPTWAPDVSAPVCFECRTNFTFFRRRHHCRNCGHVFCSECSAYHIPIPNFGYKYAVRVCTACYLRLTK